MMSENEHMAAWAMQELSRPSATFSERVEARRIIGEIVKQADARQGAVSLSGEQWERVLAWLHVPVPPGPAKALDESIIRAINAQRRQG